MQATSCKVGIDERTTTSLGWLGHVSIVCVGLRAGLLLQLLLLVVRRRRGVARPTETAVMLTACCIRDASGVLRCRY